VHINIYASASYIHRRGMPKTPEDLDGHSIIVYGEDARPPVQDLNWLLRLGVKPGQRRTPVLCINNVYAIFKALQAGIGIGALPEFMVQGADDLVRVLPQIQGPRIDAYFVYPEELRNSKRIQVFRDFLLQQVAKSQF
jgi:DNA-binding transcriptional LysR family regulator